MGPTANDFQAWTAATNDLPWGAQRALYNTLELVRDGKVHLTYGADYSSDNTPCLINAAANMLSSVNGVGGSGKPSRYFYEIVSHFDNLNNLLYRSHVNVESGKVSELAAEFLLYNFAPLKEKPVEAAVEEALINEAFAENIYIEKSDEDFTREWLNALQVEAPDDETVNRKVTSDGQTSRDAEAKDYEGARKQQG